MRLFRRPRPALPPAESYPTAAVLDMVAEAYAAHPGGVADLLIHHAKACLALDAAVIDPHAADHEIAMAAEQAEATRDALLTYCTGGTR